MTEGKTQGSIYTRMPSWHALLPMQTEVALDVFLERKMGTNKLFNLDQRKILVEALYKSLSLDTDEKGNVLREYKSFSQFQYDELLKVWSEEQEKFIKLEKEHPKGISRLIQKCFVDWAFLLGKDTFFLAEVEKALNTTTSEDEIEFILEITEKVDDPSFRYYASELLIERFTKPETRQSHLFNLYNINLYSGIISNNITHKNYEDRVNRIRKLKLDDKQKNYLRLFFILYFGKHKGFHTITEKQLIFLTEQSKIIDDTADTCADFTYLYLEKIGKKNIKEANKAVEYALKTANRTIGGNGKISLQLVKSKLEKNGNEKILTHTLFFTLILTATCSSEIFDKHLRPVFQQIYDFLFENIRERKVLALCSKSLAQVMFLEVILSKNSISQSWRIKNLLTENEDIDVKFMVSLFENKATSLNLMNEMFENSKTQQSMEWKALFLIAINKAKDDEKYKNKVLQLCKRHLTYKEGTNEQPFYDFVQRALNDDINLNAKFEKRYLDKLEIG